MDTPSTDRSTVPDVAGRDLPTRRQWDGGPYDPPACSTGSCRPAQGAWARMRAERDLLSEGRWASEPVVEGSGDSGNPKDAIGDTKPALHLVPPALSIYAAEAMKNGARKYGPYNWREKKVRATVYVSAVLRHIQQYLDGEETASDSGVHHLGHAVAGLGILLDAMATGNLIDDRPVSGAAARLIEEFTERAA